MRKNSKMTGLALCTCFAASAALAAPNFDLEFDLVDGLGLVELSPATTNINIIHYNAGIYANDFSTEMDV